MPTGKPAAGPARRPRPRDRGWDRLPGTSGGHWHRPIADRSCESLAAWGRMSTRMPMYSLDAHWQASCRTCPSDLSAHWQAEGWGWDRLPGTQLLTKRIQAGSPIGQSRANSEFPVSCVLAGWPGPRAMPANNPTGTATVAQHDQGCGWPLADSDRTVRHCPRTEYLKRQELEQNTCI